MAYVPLGAGDNPVAEVDRLGPVNRLDFLAELSDLLLAAFSWNRLSLPYLLIVKFPSRPPIPYRCR